MLNLNSKILESIVCDSIDKHLSSTGILHLNQWEFRKGISTESLLLYLTETWKKAIDSGYKIGVIFVDFKKGIRYRRPSGIKIQTTGSGYRRGSS